MKTRHPHRGHQPSSKASNSVKWWKAGYPESGLTNTRRSTSHRHQKIRFRFPNSESKQGSWHVLVTATVFVSCLLPILTLRYAEPLKSRIATWKAAHQTRAIIAQASTTPASDTLSRLVPVLQGHSAQPELIRSLAFSARSKQPEHAISLLYRLRSLGHATLQDELELGRLLVGSGRHSRAQELFASLMQSNPDSVEPWIECGKTALLQGDRVKAQSAFQHVVDTNPNNVTAQIALTQTLHHSSDATAAVESTDRLLELASDFVAKLDWKQADVICTALTHLPHLSPEQKKGFLDLTQQTTHFSLEVLLARECMDSPSTLDHEQLVALRLRWKNHLDSGTLATVDRNRGLRWIQNLGDHDFILECTPDATPKGDPNLLLTRLISLLSMGQWDAANHLMAHPQTAMIPLDPVIIDAFNSFRTTAGSTRHSRLENLLTRSEPSRNAETAYVLGMLSLASGSYDLGTKGLTRAIEANPSWSLPADSLIFAARKIKREGSSILASIQHLSRLPISINLRKRIAYLELLNNQDIIGTEREINALAKATPSDPVVRMLVAFARYKQSDLTGAVKSLVPLPQYRWHQGEAAVILSIMASGGCLDQTASLALSIKKDGLLREERELVTPWLEALAQQPAITEPAVASTR
jgi:tetratricopeptide (TPR) repeat protein